MLRQRFVTSDYESSDSPNSSDLSDNMGATEDGGVSAPRKVRRASALLGSLPGHVGSKPTRAFKRRSPCVLKKYRHRRHPCCCALSASVCLSPSFSLCLGDRQTGACLFLPNCLPVSVSSCHCLYACLLLSVSARLCLYVFTCLCFCVRVFIWVSACVSFCLSVSESMCFRSSSLSVPCGANDCECVVSECVIVMRSLCGWP